VRVLVVIFLFVSVCLGQELPRIRLDGKEVKDINDLMRRAGVGLRRQAIDPTGRYLFGVRGEGMLDVMAYDLRRERLLVVARLGYGQKAHDAAALLRGEASIWPFRHFMAGGGFAAGYQIRDANRNFHWDPGEVWELFLIKPPSTTPKKIAVSYTVPVFAFSLDGKHLFYAVTLKKGGATELFMRRLRGTSVKRLHELGQGVECAYLAPSPDGKKVAVLERYDRKTFCLVVLELKKRKILLEMDITPKKGANDRQILCWMPDSSGLLVQTESGVKVAKLGKKGLEKFTPLYDAVKKLKLKEPDIFLVPTTTRRVLVVNVVKETKRFSLAFHPLWKKMERLALPPEAVVLTLQEKHALVLRGSGEYTRTVVAPVKWEKKH